jgi:hypothetical protein
MEGARAPGKIRRKKFDHLPPIPPPIYTAPPHRTKARHHFSPFELFVHSYSPATTVRDGLICTWWTSTAADLPPLSGQDVVVFLRRVRLLDHCEYLPTLA